jgi:hypothetical protein
MVILLNAELHVTNTLCWKYFAWYDHIGVCCRNHSGKEVNVEGAGSSPAVLVEKLPGGGCAMQDSAMLLLCRKDQLKALMDFA